ncbi:MAG TPA: N-formylglutamate amidohydrolase, partial [Roseiarcus sp.]|nr:N-formylglutamate amidohydrolase [Roseiarcus sp.]
ERRRDYFDPYHAALKSEIARLRQRHNRVALYDCHSIRSAIPRLFNGELPAFNLGTNSGASADPGLIAAVAKILQASGQSFVVDGRFKGGWITRRFGKPAEGVDALQMELACRAYMREPETVGLDNWPTPYEPTYAAATRGVLQEIFSTILAWLG